jgi:ribonuclease P protein component
MPSFNEAALQNTPVSSGPGPLSHAFPKSHHLRLPREFDAVYAAKTRESRGPLTVYAQPNDLGHPRLGMSVSRKVGIAVRRNRIRRLLREAFRLMQHDMPRGYDLVIVVRPHEPLMLADYQKALSGATAKLHQTWSKRETLLARP